MPGAISYPRFSHPIVEIVRADSLFQMSRVQRDDDPANLAFGATHKRVWPNLEAIERVLLEQVPEQVPEALRDVAYLSGVDVWQPMPGAAPYAKGEAMNRIINDDTVTTELLDLRDRYVERSLTVASEDAARSARKTFEDKCLTIVLGGSRDGMRPISPEFDKRLLEARQRYKRELLRGVHRHFDDNPDRDARREYLDEVRGIIFDWFEQYDRKNAPEPERVADAAPPAPERKPAPALVSRVVAVEVVDNQSTAGETEREQEFERTVTQEVERSLAEGPDVALLGKLQTSAATMPYEQYDKKLSEAWKAPPKAPKRKKRGREVGDVL